jgi:hypothetical protein
MPNIKFTGETVEDLIYNPERSQNTFYQICQFKNKSSNLYQTRKIIFDEKHNIIKIYEKSYGAKILEKFIKQHENLNKLKMYPVEDISTLDLPNSNDFMMVCSNLANQTKQIKNKDKTGFDSFNSMNYRGIQNTHTMASPGFDISNQTRRVGGADPSFYTGAPTKENMMMINNNLV